MELVGIEIKPTFAGLVAAEEELGPLFALVERAAAGQLKLSEMAALFWHCRHNPPEELQRFDFCQKVAEQGLSRTVPVLKALLNDILSGARK